MIKKLLLGMAIISVSLVGCKPKGSEEQKNELKDEISISVAPAVAGDFIQYGSYYGEVSAFRTATLIATGGGQVTSIKVKEGDRVRSGKSLASIDAGRAQASLDLAVLNEKVAKEQYERTQKQFAKENVSKVMLDNSHIAWLNSKKTLVDTQKMWRGALAIPPMNGIVTARHIELNDELAPGSPTFTVAQTHKLKIIVGIPESEIVGVSEGNSAEVTFAIYPNRVWHGTITRLSRQVSVGKRTFFAEITIDNEDQLLSPGLTAKTVIVREQLQDKITVPTEIIVTRGNDNFVMIMVDGKAVKRAVTLSSSDELRTVIETGIDVGDTLIIEGSQMVTDGTPVKVQSLN